MDLTLDLLLEDRALSPLSICPSLQGEKATRAQGCAPSQLGEGESFKGFPPRRVDRELVSTSQRPGPVRECICMSSKGVAVEGSVVLGKGLR